jgi:hypothetical protein
LAPRSTILTSQIPVDKWHAFIGPTYADAILDHPPTHPTERPQWARVAAMAAWAAVAVAQVIVAIVK